MMNLAVGSSSRSCASVLTGLCASLLCAATFTGSAHAASSIFATTGTSPRAITIDSAGNIYTANMTSNDVSKITPAGTSTILGTTGSAPIGITVDSAGNIYTANYDSDNVTKITPGGVSTTNWAATGANPQGITVDSAGNIYTANRGSNDVTKITPSGVSTTNWALTGSSPIGITVDSAGNIYTANYTARNVSKITPDGTSTILGATGTNPIGITVDSAGNIYTANMTSNDVSKITPDGTSTILATTGTNPRAITIDSAGNIYTANYGSNDVSKITPGGTSTILGTTGTDPIGITVDSAGNIYTSNAGSSDVSKITPAAAPAAPTSLVATAGNASASIAFTPGADGGAAITNYEYSVDNGSTWTTRSPTSAASPVVISGLANGTTYQIKLRAINSAGTGAESSAASVTPAAAPAAPTGLVATPGDGSASIAFTPGSGNGAAITNYQYSTNNGGSWTTRNPTSDASPVVISGLTNGTTYQIKLRAINSAGTGAESSAVSGTPVAAPAAPTSLVATLGDGSASIAFTAGADNGAAITNYEYSTDGGATWVARSPSSTVSPVVITALTNGTTYQIKLRAINSVGTGAASSAASVTPAATLPPPAPKPAKPAATWASSAKAKTVTAVITPVAGVTYTLTAISGRKTKKGSCKNVTIKKGKKKLARRSCTVKLAKGKWLATVTPKKGSVGGTANTKSYTFK